MPLIHKYFVLKPRGSDAQAIASRVAMRVYATEIEATDPQLAYELKSWAHEAAREAHIKSIDGGVA